MEQLSIPERVIRRLGEQKITLSCAESCTGGLASELLTRTPGASAVFRGGVVSYTNDVKRVVLGVSSADLKEKGAVSDAVARQMAAGVRLLLHSDVAVSITGVAGPDKDDRDNPVGDVYLAVAAKNDVVSAFYHFSGDRAEIRRQAALQALAMTLDYLEQSPDARSSR